MVHASEPPKVLWQLFVSSLWQQEVVSFGAELFSQGQDETRAFLSTRIVQSCNVLRTSVLDATVGGWCRT